MGRVHRALAVECVYSGRPLDEAVAHGRQAVSLLERTEDRFWLSQALYALSYSCYYSGDFESALEAAGRLDALGEAIGSRRARANAAMMAGLSRATRGDWEAGIKACERALELSPDPFETAFVLAVLARPTWRRRFRACNPHSGASRATGGSGSLPAIRRMVSDNAGCSLCPGGQPDKAREVAKPGSGCLRGRQILAGDRLVPSSPRSGRPDQGALAQAGMHLGEALQAFASVHSRFEMGRTHLFLASLAYAQGDREPAGTHLKEAHSLFVALRVPEYVERTEQLAVSFAFPPSRK